MPWAPLEVVRRQSGTLTLEPCSGRRAFLPAERGRAPWRAPNSMRVTRSSQIVINPVPSSLCIVRACTTGGYLGVAITPLPLIVGALSP